MTQLEFMIRTGYTPSAEEFGQIHDEYCNSPFNKDEFCKVWAHNNAHRYKSPVVHRYLTEEQTAKAVMDFTWRNSNFRVVGRTTIYWYD